MKIHIQTTQNVDLEYEVAGIGYRFISALIDMGILVGYVILALLILGGIDAPLGWAVWALFSLPLLLYPLVCEMTMDGQTFGKKAMKLKVVKVDGAQPSSGDYILRWLLWIIEANPFVGLFGLASIGIISIVSTRYGQRLGDLAAGTTVVRMSSQTEISSTIFQPVGENYTPKWPQVTKLNDRDIAVIRKGFDAMDKGADPTLLTNIAYKVASVLEIDRHQMGTSDHFLKTIISDYNFYTVNAAT